MINGDKVLWAAMIGFAIAAAATACRNDGGHTTPSPQPSLETFATSSTTPALPTLSPDSSSPAIVIDQPVVDGNTYTFARKGYSVQAPDAWTGQPNASFDVAQAQYPMDIFFNPGTVNGIQPNVAISCLKPQPDISTTEQFRDRWRSFLQALVGTDATPVLTSVSGNTAYEFDYRQDLGGGGAINGEKTDIVFVRGQCRWLISLLVPSGLRAQYSDVFSSLVKSFKLLY